MKAYWQLTKGGIGVFVLLTGLIGYAASLPIGQPLDGDLLFLLMLGLYLVSSGSFALNQFQEVEADVLMPRTAQRPLPTGVVAPWQALVLSLLMMFFGLVSLYLAAPLAAYLAGLTILLYNGFYTLVWKRRSAFAAVPGAIPGALPVLIGYSINDGDLLGAEPIYLFLIIFLWQMPHFWCLALRFREDYRRGGFPVLPVRMGEGLTLYFIGLYLFVYVGVALLVPVFFAANLVYVFVVIPLAMKLLWEFFRYFSVPNSRQWLPFFMWVNVSMLAFLMAPVLDRWIFFYLIG